MASIIDEAVPTKQANSLPEDFSWCKRVLAIVLIFSNFEPGTVIFISTESKRNPKNWIDWTGSSTDLSRFTVNPSLSNLVLLSVRSPTQSPRETCQELDRLDWLSSTDLSRLPTTA